MAPLVVTAKVLQQKGTKLYLFAMNSKALSQVSYATVRSENDPKEIQRLLSKKRAKEIGQYIQQADSLMPTAIVINLRPEVKISPTGEPNEVAITFPDDGAESTKKYAYILDGQHRLEGFNHSGGLTFDLPVVAIYNASDATRAKIFVDINSKQVKVSKVHVHSLGYDFGTLDALDQVVAAVVERLNEDADSPLQGHVKVMEGQKGTWVDNFKLASWLKPLISSGGELHSLTTAQQAHVVKEYFKGIEQAWPGVWGSDKYRLSRPLGIEIMLRIFPKVKHRCDLYRGFQYTAQNFAAELAPLRDFSVKLDGGVEVDLTWEVGSMQYFSNQAMRGVLVNQMRDALNVGGT